MKNDYQSPWNDNLTQFARLISELEAEACFNRSVMEKLQSSMDLDESQICELIDRAQTVWEQRKRDTSRKNTVSNTVSCAFIRS
jgi:hypothetical protein